MRWGPVEQRAAGLKANVARNPDGLAEARLPTSKAWHQVPLELRVPTQPHSEVEMVGLF